MSKRRMKAALKKFEDTWQEKMKKFQEIKQKHSDDPEMLRKLEELEKNANETHQLQVEMCEMMISECDSDA